MHSTNQDPRTAEKPRFNSSVFVLSDHEPEHVQAYHGMSMLQSEGRKVGLPGILTLRDGGEAGLNFSACHS